MFMNSSPSANKSRVHSAGCVRDGKAICACDFPAARYISQTVANPGKPFYRCGHNKCSFWKWERDLGAGLRPSAPQQTSQRQTNRPDTPPATPRNSASQLPLSPPHTQSPAKRSYAHMSTGSRPRPGSSQQHVRVLSPGARERRDAEIQAAVAGLDKDKGTGMTPSGSAADVQASDSDDEYERRSVEESSSSEDEPSPPVNKRTRFAIKTEEEESLAPDVHTPLRRSSASLSRALPTPSQTSERGSATEIEDFFGGTGPASPTSFTRGAQRALERARSNADAIGSGLNKGKYRAMNVNPNSNGDGGGKSEGLNDPASVPSGDDVAEGNEHGHESFQAQLASTIQKSGTNVKTPASCVRDSNVISSSSVQSSAATTMLTSLSSMAAQQTTLQTALHDLLAELERLRRKATAAGKSAAFKERYIAKLQDEIAELKTRNAELESFRDQIQNVTQSTPPRK